VKSAVTIKEQAIFEITAFIIIAVFIIALAVMLIGNKVPPALNKIRRAEPDIIKTNCPLCGSVIKKGERVKTVAYSGGGEKLVQLYGCPACYPPGKLIGRICPVCGKELPVKGYVIGKMWKEGNKLRLNITGCSVCKPDYFRK
jgi:formate dehydrogenase maturation protein FdhE